MVSLSLATQHATVVSCTTLIFQLSSRCNPHKYSEFTCSADGLQNMVWTASGGRCLDRTSWVRRSMYADTRLCSSLHTKHGTI
jgi:hypothetical protein